MGACDIIVIAVIALAVVAVIGVGIYKKIKGKGGCCDCGCSGTCDKCAGTCHSERSEESHR